MAANHTFAGPGTFTVTFTATPAVGAAGQAQITVNVIGGPATSSGNARWFCGAADPNPPTVSAAGGQPAGTTYLWAIVPGGAGAGTVAFVGGVAAATATVRGTSASAAANDVTIRLTYSRGAGALAATCQSNITMTVSQPTAMPLVASAGPTTVYYPADVPATPFYGFTGQSRTYQVNDQFGNAMPNTGVNEIWDTVVANPRQPAWTGPANANGATNGAGQATDSFWWQGYNGVVAIAPALVAPAFVSMGSLRQRLWAGSGTSGAGCGPFHTYNVQYFTNGVRGF